MSAVWKLAQARFMLDRSREYKDRSRLHTEGQQFPNAYGYYVDATIHALYGVVDYLRNDFARATSVDGVTYEDWSKALVRETNDQSSVLGLLFRKGEGARQLTTHRSPLLLSSRGTQGGGVTFSVIASDDGLDSVQVVEDDVERNGHFDWYFQQLHFEGLQPGAPEWKRKLGALSVDTILERALGCLLEYVVQAFEMFEELPEGLDIRCEIEKAVLRG